jgi:hypothetical protein
MPTVLAFLMEGVRPFAGVRVRFTHSAGRRICSLLPAQAWRRSSL